METVISLFVSILCVYLLYRVFENYGLGVGIIFNVIYCLAVLYIDKSLSQILTFDINYIITFFVILFIIISIATLILYCIFKNTRSFLAFLILGSIAGLGLLYAIENFIPYLMGLVL